MTERILPAFREDGCLSSFFSSRARLAQAIYVCRYAHRLKRAKPCFQSLLKVVVHWLRVVVNLLRISKPTPIFYQSKIASNCSSLVSIWANIGRYVCRYYVGRYYHGLQAHSPKKIGGAQKSEAPFSAQEGGINLPQKLVFLLRFRLLFCEYTKIK